MRTLCFSVLHTLFGRGPLRGYGCEEAYLAQATRPDPVESLRASTGDGRDASRGKQRESSRTDSSVSCSSSSDGGTPPAKSVHVRPRKGEAKHGIVAEAVKGSDKESRTATVGVEVDMERKSKVQLKPGAIRQIRVAAHPERGGDLDSSKVAGSGSVSNRQKDVSTLPVVQPRRPRNGLEMGTSFAKQPVPKDVNMWIRSCRLRGTGVKPNRLSRTSELNVMNLIYIFHLTAHTYLYSYSDTATSTHTLTRTYSLARATGALRCLLMAPTSQESCGSHCRRASVVARCTPHNE